MQLQNFKLTRLMLLLENSKREVIEDMYYYCFSEYPVDNLSVEDMQFNISKYLSTADNKDISRIYKYTHD
jgi:hypothetical protein